MSATFSTSDGPSCKRKDKGKEKEVLTWKDYIQPDSRHCKPRSGSVSLKSSEEEFDFSGINQESSDSDMAIQQKQGQLSSMKQVVGKQLWKDRGLGECLHCNYFSINSIFIPQIR
jgi:hypothetical protein